MATALKTKNRRRELSDFESYTTAQKRLVELESQQAELKAKVDALPKGTAARNRQSIGQKAVDLITGKHPDPPRETAANLAEKLKVVDQAVRIAKNAYEHEWRLASAEICRDHLPRHRELIADTIASLDALVTAYQAVCDHNVEVQDFGVNVSLPRVQFQACPLLDRALIVLSSRTGEGMIDKIHRDNSKGRK